MTDTVAGLKPLSLAAVAASPGQARRYVRDSVVSLGHPELIDAVVLAASELATNAYLHARTRFVVSVGETAHGTIRLGVSDSGAASPVQRDADLWASQGRGLRLLDATGEWGVEWNADGTAGKTVWFEPAPAV